MLTAEGLWQGNCGWAGLPLCNLAIVKHQSAQGGPLASFHGRAWCIKGAVLQLPNKEHVLFNARQWLKIKKCD